MGCEAEIYFYYGDDPNSNMILTDGYFNPVATNYLVVKMMTGANDHTFMEKICFIGVLSGDNTTTVNKCIEKAFKMLMKRCEFIEQQKIEGKKMNSMSDRHVIESDNFFDHSEEDPKEIDSPKRFSRILRNHKTKKTVTVDLTDGDEDKTGDEEITDELYFDVCCSEILEIGPSLEDCYDASIKGLSHEWDEKSDTSKTHIKATDTCLAERWLSSEDLKKFPFRYKIEIADEDVIREPSKNIAKQGKACSSTSSRYLLQESLNETKAMNHYNKKAEEDRSDFRLNQLLKDKECCTTPEHTELSRSPDRRCGSLNINITPRTVSKSNLFTDEELKKNEEATKKRLKQSSNASKRCYAKPELPKFMDIKDFQIPKKDFRSPDRGITPSVISQSPCHISGRRSIHDDNTTSSITKYHGRSKESNLKKMMMPMESDTFSPSNYSPRSEAKAPQRAPNQVNRLADRVEVIDLDKDDEEEENSDVNNNGQHKRRRLLSIDQPNANNLKKNRIFVTKQRKPEYQYKKESRR